VARRGAARGAGRVPAERGAGKRAHSAEYRKIVRLMTRLSWHYGTTGIVSAVRTRILSASMIEAESKAAIVRER